MSEGLGLIADYERAVDFFTGTYPKDKLPLNPDGTVDYKSLAGEFLVEGVPFAEVKKHMDALDKIQITFNPQVFTRK